MAKKAAVEIGVEVNEETGGADETTVAVSGPAPLPPPAVPAPEPDPATSDSIVFLAGEVTSIGWGGREYRAKKGEIALPRLAVEQGVAEAFGLKPKV